MIDFSRDVDKQMINELKTKRADEKKIKENTERNLHVDYDFTDRDAAKVETKEDSGVPKVVSVDDGVDVKDDKADGKYKRFSFDGKNENSVDNELVK